MNRKTATLKTLLAHVETSFLTVISILFVVEYFKTCITILFSFILRIDIYHIGKQNWKFISMVHQWC